MTMTPQAQSLLTTLEANYQKAAFWANNYTSYNLPFCTTKNLSLPSDRWNRGCNHRILIPAGAKIRLVCSKETYELGVGGRDSDKLIGLWVSDFTYNW